MRASARGRLGCVILYKKAAAVKVATAAAGATGIAAPPPMPAAAPWLNCYVQLLVAAANPCSPRLANTAGMASASSTATGLSGSLSLALALRQALVMRLAEPMMRLQRLRVQVQRPDGKRVCHKGAAVGVSASIQLQFQRGRRRALATPHRRKRSSPCARCPQRRQRAYEARCNAAQPTVVCNGA